MVTTTNPTRRQLVGRRLGVTPYYTVTKGTDSYLLLRSQPTANRSVGYRTIAIGGTLLTIGLLIGCSGLLTSMQDAQGNFASLAFAAAIGAICGSLGLQRIAGGVAVATTQNSVAIDQGERKITYSQTNRVARERSQVLRFDQVAEVRLKPRTLLRGRELHPQAIVALELVPFSGDSWIVDSASDAAQLRDVGKRIARHLGMELVESTEQNPAR